MDVIHADRTQQQRDDVVKAFREGKVWVLICTELIGRGIDFLGVNLVINYDFPSSAISYIHRIGRTGIEIVNILAIFRQKFYDFFLFAWLFTGRAGRKGKAITYFTQDDKPRLRSIANILRNSGCKVPDYMLTLKKRSKKVRRELEKTVPKRQDIAIKNPNQIRMQKKTNGKIGKKAHFNGKLTSTNQNGNATKPGQFVLLPKKRKATAPVEMHEKKKKKKTNKKTGE